MTQTNRMAQETPTLDAIIEAVRKIERDTDKVLVEYKIHPDDWNELRAQLTSTNMVTYPNNDPLRGPEFFGLRLVLDRSAARLPRQVPNSKLCGDA